MFAYYFLHISAFEDITMIYGPGRLLHVNNNGTDQPAHPRSLISAFDVHSL